MSRESTPGGAPRRPRPSKRLGDCRPAPRTMYLNGYIRDPAFASMAMPVNVWAWRMHYGTPPPGGAEVLKTCGRLNCVNPDHLTLRRDAAPAEQPRPTRRGARARLLARLKGSVDR